jgi:hypothetical protein
MAKIMKENGADVKTVFFEGAWIQEGRLEKESC